MSAATVPSPTRGDSPGPRFAAAPMFGTQLGGAPVSAEGLFLSAIFHCLFALLTLVVPWNYWFPSAVHLVTLEAQARAQEALLLPDLQPTGAASEAAPAPAIQRSQSQVSAARTAARNLGHPAAAKAVRGVAYEGPQIIVSNPPHPDNSQQTILQPDLPPSRLPAPLPVPPMVSIARATPVLAPPPLPKPPQPEPTAQPVPVLPMSASQQLPKVEAPKLALPTSGAAQALSAAANAAVPPSLPKLARAPVPLASASGDAAHNILVIDAVPVANARPSEIPAGELHGAFTVAPSGVFSQPLGVAGGGTAAAGVPGVGNGTGTASSTYAGSAAGAGVGSGIGPAAGVATGTGLGAGSGEGVNPGSGNGAGTVAGTGVAGGTGVIGGTGPANSKGHGVAGASGSGGGISIIAGNGTGAGNSPFSGITIQGGGSGNNHVARTTKSQTSYDVTIVANGASGGGFRDYGVFNDGASYTVYVDMTDVGVGDTWTLQYAPERRSAPGAADPPIQGKLEPPFAIKKTLPHISADAARRSHGGTVVVYGVINANGQWEGLRVMQTPDPAFNSIVLEALRKWVFQPAKTERGPVAVKCLLGVPVYSLTGD